MINIKRAVLHPHKPYNYIMRRIQELKYNYNLKKIIFDLEDIEIDRPIFLLGTQGGGLTFVSRMIRRNPKLVYICGNHKRWGYADELHNSHSIINENIPDELSLRAPGYNNVSEDMDYHPIFGYQRSWLYATDEFLSQYRLTEKDATDSLSNEFKKIIRKSIIAHSPDKKNTRFTDMSQSFTVKVSFINELLSETDPKFLLVTRNPYAMCYREVTKNTDKYGNYEKRLSYKRNLKLACEHWSNSFKYALKDRKKVEDFRIVRFEDVLQNPKEKMRKICDYLDLEFKNDMIPQPHHKFPLGAKEKNKWYPVRPNVNESYLQQLSDREVEMIEHECAPFIEEFGYTPNGKKDDFSEKLESDIHI